MVTDSETNLYNASKKKVWLIYAAVIACLIVFLVLVVASDMEEKLFYSLMTAAASYAFRPNDDQIAFLVDKIFSVKRPKDESVDGSSKEVDGSSEESEEQ